MASRLHRAQAILMKKSVAEAALRPEIIWARRQFRRVYAHSDWSYNDLTVKQMSAKFMILTSSSPDLALGPYNIIPEGGLPRRQKLNRLYQGCTLADIDTSEPRGIIAISLKQIK